MTVEELKKEIEKLTDEQRMEVFEHVCSYCGDYNEVSGCQCWNDE